MTLSAFLSPIGLLLLYTWCFVVLAAAQLTVRLIMAFSILETARAALVLTIGAIPIAYLYDLVVGPEAGLATRIEWAWLPMLLMGLLGIAVARWLLRFKRLRGQLITGGMVALLAPQLFTLLIIS